jgi:hypothetical protein
MSSTDLDAAGVVAVMTRRSYGFGWVVPGVR